MPNLLEIINGLWNAEPEFLQWYISQGRSILDILHLIFDNLFYVFLFVTATITSIYIIFSLSVAFSRKKTNEKRFDAEKAPYVTIQIPTRNEIVALRCARRCLNFDYPKDRYEILIGDDSNDKSVSNQLDQFAAENTMVKVIRRRQNIGFKPGNLNNMLKHTNGEIIVIFDSDFTPERDFLKRIVAPFQKDKGIAAVQAKWNFSNFNQNMITILASTIVHVFHHIVLSFMNIFGYCSLCGSAEAVRKRDLVELGGWKSGALTEDVEYALRLQKNKKKIVYLPKLQCYSDVPYIATDLYKQQMRWAYGAITAYKEHIKDILLSAKMTTKDKLMSMCHGFGYLMPISMVVLFMLGVLSFVTHSPGPIDLVRFFSELGRNVLLTCGMLVVSIIVLYKEKHVRSALKMLASSFTIGVVTTYYVNKGILKSLLGQPMKWYLLNKAKE